MDKKTDKKKGDPVALFKTLAITDDYKREPEMNLPIPSDFDVKEAKDWVDHNEK